jgi:hypothetical protein
MRRLRNLNLEVILGLLCFLALWIAVADPFGWSGYREPKPDWHSASCYKIPERYHGGLYCSDQEAGGDHGYVNPGSMEWEVE